MEKTKPKDISSSSPFEIVNSLIPVNEVTVRIETKDNKIVIDKETVSINGNTEPIEYFGLVPFKSEVVGILCWSKKIIEHLEQAGNNCIEERTIKNDKKQSQEAKKLERWLEKLGIEVKTTENEEKELVIKDGFEPMIKKGQVVFSMKPLKIHGFEIDSKNRKATKVRRKKMSIKAPENMKIKRIRIKQGEIVDYGKIVLLYYTSQSP